MKEQTMIQKFKLGEQQRLQNNRMIGQLNQDVNNLQQMVSGFLGVLRKLPGYDEAITELAEEHEATLKAEEAAAKEMEVVEPEEVKKLDLGDE